MENFLTAVRTLSEHKPRIGVFFESEKIYSLKEDSQMALSFQATMAEEESRNKSRSMETSLRMRLDHGLPLTPKLLGYQHDEDGKLIIDPETWKIPKLIMAGGSGVIIDHVITNERIFRQLKEMLQAYPLYTVHVTCPVKVLREREKARGDRCPGSAESSAAYLYPKEGYDMTVRTDQGTPAENAALICTELFEKGDGRV